MSDRSAPPRRTPTFAQLLDAIRFLTILPVPDAERAPEPDWLTRAMTFFPIVGVGIGVISAAVLLLGNSLFGPGSPRCWRSPPRSSSPARCTRTASPTPSTASAAAGRSSGGSRS